MKKINLLQILIASNVKRATALIMALMLLTFAGCNKNPTTSSQGGSSNESSKVDSSNVSSNISSEENSSVTSTQFTPNSSVTMTSSYIDPLDGEIITEADHKENNIRSDVSEKKPTVDPANLAYGYKGYAEKERNKRLDEILNTKNTLEYYTPKKGAKIYYVSPGGNNSNDGLSPETALKSIDATYSLPLQPGDFILFERDSIYRLYERFYLKDGVTYGSYGKGTKPMFYGSPNNFADEVWKPSQKKNVWQINYMYSYPCGGFFNEGEEIGYMKLSLRDLSANTHFYFDESKATLYLYCDKGNPSKVWDSIEFSQTAIEFHLSTNVDNVTIDNIAIRYTGPGGVSALFANDHMTVTNCEIGYTGGQQLGVVRAGNGIGTWCGGEYLKWDHNWVYQTFDSGMSPQGNSGHNTFDYHDISMSDNLFEFNNADIELWESGKEENGGPSFFKNWKMDNNIHRFTSLGWGTRADDGGIRGIDGVHYGHTRGENQIIGEFTFNNNIIDCPGRMVYKFTIEGVKDFNNWQRKGNVYYIKQSMRTTNSLTYNFHWENGASVSTSATNKAQTLEAFAKFEPDAKVYWYE